MSRAARNRLVDLSFRFYALLSIQSSSSSSKLDIFSSYTLLNSDSDELQVKLESCFPGVSNEQNEMMKQEETGEMRTTQPMNLPESNFFATHMTPVTF